MYRFETVLLLKISQIDSKCPMTSFRLFVANAIVGVAAIILMTPGVVYQVWYSEEQAEVSYCHSGLWVSI